MADNAVIHLGENSPEHVAFKLFTFINDGENNRDRAAVLDLYAECLLAVRNPAGHLKGNHETLSQRRR